MSSGKALALVSSGRDGMSSLAALRTLRRLSLAQLDIDARARKNLGACGHRRQDGLFPRLPVQVSLRRYPVSEKWPDVVRQLCAEQAAAKLHPHDALNLNVYRRGLRRPSIHELAMRQLVALRDRVIGFCVYGYSIYLHSDDNTSKSAVCLNLNLHATYVAKRHRGKGYGKVLAGSIGLEAGFVAAGIASQLRDCDSELALRPELYADTLTSSGRRFTDRVLEQWHASLVPCREWYSRISDVDDFSG